MTMAPEKVEELLERVRKAGRGSDELDLDVFDLREHEPFRSIPLSFGRYSTSLDACIVLLRETLPEWIRTAEEDYDGVTEVTLTPPYAGQVILAEGKSEPIALLDCILQALLSQQDVKETRE